MTASDWADVFSIITCLVLIVSAFFAYLAFRANIAANKFSKSVDVMMKCSDRYDQIHVDRAGLDRSGSDPNEIRDVEKVYKRFWGLQQFQHEMFVLGLIELGVYQKWMVHKARLFKENEIIGGVRFSDGWEKYGEPGNQENEAFIDLITQIKRIAHDSPPILRMDRVRELVAEHKKTHLRRREEWFLEGLNLLNLGILFRAGSRGASRKNSP